MANKLSVLVQAHFFHGQTGPGRGVATVQRRADGSVMRLDAGQLQLGASVGHALPEAVQRKMEAFFGADFSDVRVFQGPQAQSIGAHAFTMGARIYFARGQYAPETARGQQLLGHELTHVLQQRTGRVRMPQGGGTVVVNDHALEAEADRMGARAAAFRMPAVQARLAPQGMAGKAHGPLARRLP